MPIDEESTLTNFSAKQPMAQRRTRLVRWGSVVLVVFLLLVGAAFVGGHLLAERNVVGSAQGVRLEVPAELPKEPPAAMGSVQKVEGKTIVIEEPKGGGGVVYSDSAGVTKKQGEFGQTEVVVTQDTRIYRSIPIKPDEVQKGGQRQLELEAVSLADVRTNSTISVWGSRSGDRVVAEVIHILGLLAGP
ncbi:MAG: hypothetical protein HYY30_13625 [Chloroflexi bacterium]|nr:hypothetical protein [Chloroflexota bacterium]